MWQMCSDGPGERSVASEAVTAYERLDRTSLFMEVARLYAQRSTCLRAHVGAVAVRDGRIICAGYNGAPAGTSHCLDVGCELGSEQICTRAVHAEANLIAWAARTGVALLGTTLVCTHAPCRNCAKLILNAGFAYVTYERTYHDDGLMLLKGIVRLNHWNAYAS